MIFLKQHWQLTVFVIAVLGISGYLFYQSQQESDLNITGVDVKTSDPTTEKVPVGDTSQGGHWHGDEWHAEPHDTPAQPVAKTSTNGDGTNDLRVTFNNTEISNPLLPSRVGDLPDHLKLPEKWVGLHYWNDDAESDKAVEYLEPIVEEIITRYNPNRSIHEFWSDFIEKERQYYTEAIHDLTRPKTYYIPPGGGRLDREYLQLLNYPEIAQINRNPNAEEHGRVFEMWEVERGSKDPDFNLTILPDGRRFRLGSTDYLFKWIDPNGKVNEFSTTGPAHIAPLPDIIINLNETTDEQLKELSGWNYNISRYTNQPILQ